MTADDDSRAEVRQSASVQGDGYVAARDVHVHHAPARVAAEALRAWGNVPARNAAFTGRESTLSAIRAELASSRRVAVQALYGMGGVGKTQLAIEYAHRFGGDYDVVWWLDGENMALFTQQFCDLGVTLRCAEQGAPPDAVRRAVLSDLHHREGWLLVFDNAENPGEIREWLPSGSGHVLITSRSAAWNELAVPVPVDVLVRAESVELLWKWVPGLPEPEAEALAEALGDLPLALAQAAAYLAETKTTAAEYGSLLLNRATELLREGKLATYRDNLTAATTLSYDRLRALDKGAADLAAICSFLAPEPIPVEWFTAVELPDGLAARLTDPLDRSRLLAALTTTSLARLDDDGLVMHRLSQAILRDHVQSPAAIRAFAEAVAMASDPGDRGRLPGNWPAWARMVPHLLALDPARCGNKDLRIAAGSAAWYLTTSGNARDAAGLAAQLREQWLDRLGPDHGQTLRIANALGEALRGLGRYDQARELDEDTLARRRRLGGDDDQDTLASAGSLAGDLRGLGEYAAARVLDEDTLARRRRVLGDDHPHTLISAGSLAGDLHALGEYAAARVLDEDTLARRRRVLGDDHPHTLISAGSLAGDLRGLGEYAAARVLDEDTLLRRRKVLGPDHPYTIRAAENLAEDLRGLGEYAAARVLDEDTLARRRRVLGDDHPSTIRSAENLAEDLRGLRESP